MKLERRDFPKMSPVKRTICRFWEDHRKAMVVAAATWVLVITSVYLALSGEPLKVGGLPVT